MAVQSSSHDAKRAGETPARTAYARIVGGL